MTTATPAQASARQPSRLQRILLRQETILFIILVVGVLLLSLQSDKFLTVDNLLNQGRLATEIALIALPMTLIIITGGIDLSVGSIMGLVAIMLGVAWQNWGLPLELAIVVALLIGTPAASSTASSSRGSACRRSSPRWPRWRSSAAWPRASPRPARCAATPTGSTSWARRTSWAA